MIMYFRLLIKHGFVNIQNKVKGIAKNLVKAVVLIVYFPSRFDISLAVL